MQSAFDVIIERTLTVTQNGVVRDLTVEEALQQRTCQDALQGSRSARREVLRMIAARERWIAERADPPKRPAIEFLTEEYPDNANEALLLLGIASPNPRFVVGNDRDDRLLFEPWAVEAALKRGRRREFADKELENMRCCTRDAGSIAWP